MFIGLHQFEYDRGKHYIGKISRKKYANNRIINIQRILGFGDAQQ